MLREKLQIPPRQAGTGRLRSGFDEGVGRLHSTRFIGCTGGSMLRQRPHAREKQLCALVIPSEADLSRLAVEGSAVSLHAPITLPRHVLRQTR